MAAGGRPPPTLCTLLRLDALGPEALCGGASELDVAILPKATIDGSEIHVVMPHDPEYDALPGDAIAAPARVRALPQRFTRRQGRWTPT